MMKRRLWSLAVAVTCLGFGTLAQAADKGSADEAVALVKKAAVYLKANGRDKALAEFNNTGGQFISKDLYIMAYAANGDGIALANGGNPKLAGKNLLEIKDSDGIFIVKEFIKTANGKAGSGWVDYTWPNPVTKALEKKSTYVEKVGDVILGSGIYK